MIRDALRLLGYQYRRRDARVGGGTCRARIDDVLMPASILYKSVNCAMTANPSLSPVPASAVWQRPWVSPKRGEMLSSWRSLHDSGRSERASNWGLMRFTLLITWASATRLVRWLCSLISFG